MSRPKIAIIGAGPASLGLASILYRNNIPCTVYERDESSLTRSQGGSLDLHPRTGQAALEAAGLQSQFEKRSRLEGEDRVLADNTGHRYFSRQGGDSIGRPEIDRVVLRQILLDSLLKETVKWGSNLRNAELKNGKGTLHFTDRSEHNFDLMVGGDGAWSKVRPLVTTFKPFYSSISTFDCSIRDIDNRFPKLAELVGKGSYFAFGEAEKQCLLVQRNGNGSIRMYAAGKKPEEWTNNNGVDRKTPAEMREAMLKDYSTWCEELRELIRNCDDDIEARALYMMPPGARWAHVPGVTLIGDAAHLMTPFSGEGVNIALLDSLVLAQAIVANPTDLPAATKEYEGKMFEYAKQMTQKTFDSLQHRFEPGGIQDFLALLGGRNRRS